MATFGKTTSTGSNYDNDANEKSGSKSNLPEDGTVTSLSVYFTAATGNAKIGIYAADGAGGAPSTRKVQASITGLVLGWNTVAVNVALAAGDYWLIYCTSIAKTSKYDAGTGKYVEPITYANELLATCQSMTNESALQAIYATYTPSATNVSVSDSGVGADSEVGSAALPLADAGVGSDVLGMTGTLPLSDAGSGADSVPNITLPVVDTGSGVDASGLTASIPLSDVGSGADALSFITLLLADSGVGSEVAELLLALADLGSGVDVSAVTVSLSLSDSAVGSDSMSVDVTLTLVDAGTGADVASITFGDVVQISVFDLASALDAVEVQGDISIDDSGVGAETGDLTVTVNVSDGVVGIEGIGATVPDPLVTPLIKLIVNLLEQKKILKKKTG